MKKLGSMTVNDTLGIARRSGRVTEGSSGVLINFRPVILFRLLGKKLFIIEDGKAQGEFFRGFSSENHELFDCFQMGCDLFEKGKQGNIDEDNFVLSMIDNIRYLLRGKANI